MEYQWWFSNSRERQIKSHKELADKKARLMVITVVIMIMVNIMTLNTFAGYSNRL
jgi:hypothetical protein